MLGSDLVCRFILQIQLVLGIEKFGWVAGATPEETLQGGAACLINFGEFVPSLPWETLPGAESSRQYSSKDPLNTQTPPPR